MVVGRTGSMGFTVESLREAMKYMVESQGFDRVLRKVRAGRGRPLTAATGSDRSGGGPLEAGLIV